MLFFVNINIYQKAEILGLHDLHKGPKKFDHLAKISHERKLCC